jgi:ABC-type polysaccharide/polyol phosphate transport system ATPase subunit
MKNNLAIQLKGVSKEYVIHHEKPTLVEKFIRQKNEKFLALNHIDLTIKRGERVGIIGPNGSGKTTLLKIINRITTPTSGSMTTNGKIVSLIDLEAGFHEDLTGEQNIYLNAMLLHMSKKEINRKLDKIIGFADIKQFIDAPLFTYSSGMKLRLGFSIAIQADPDIIVIDEGLGVADDSFRNKAQAKIHELFRSGKTIILASHWKQMIVDNCSRIVKMEIGSVTYDGPISSANI